MAERSVAIPIPVSVTKEKVRRKVIYIAESPLFPVASQGNSIEDALDHLQEALRSYWKNPEAKKMLSYTEIVFSGQVNMNVPAEALSHGKTTNPVRA